MPTRLAIVLGLALALLAPAAAQAAVFTVDPADANKTCSSTETTCPTIALAMQNAGAGDTVKVLKGTYAEPVNVATGKDGLKIEGANSTDVKVTGSGTGDVVSIASNNVTLSGLTVDVPVNGQSAVMVGATGATLNAVVLQRTAGVSESAPVVEVPLAGGVQILNGFVIQSKGSPIVPAVDSIGAGGVQILDTLVVSSTGPAVIAKASEANRIVRSTVLSTEENSDAVQVNSTDAGKRTLTIDSSYFVGGAKAGGIRAMSMNNTAGDISLQVRHATIAGSARGIVLDASGAHGTSVLQGGTPSGSIDADVFSSIVHGVSEAKRYAPVAVEGTPNTASLTFANSDAPPPAAGNGTVEMGGASNTPDAALFIPQSLKLRADAPVIDKGGALQPGESSTDAEGEPREVDGGDADATNQSDIGADEVVNQRPKALFSVTNKGPRQGEAVGFISGSTDPEQASGGGIAEYRWNFGDGKTEVTKAPGVAHTYTEVGSFQATLQVVDAQGLVSDVAPAQEVVVRDGVLPIVNIAAPIEGAKLNLKSTYLLGAKRPKPRQLTLKGAAVDASSGLESVEVALYVTKRDKVKKAKKKKKRSARASQVKTCEFYSGRVFSKKDCTKEIWLKANLVPGGWTLKTKKGLRLPAGRYTVRVRAKDKSGLLTTSFSTKAKTLVNFRVR
jgi:hypothetical protein